MNTQKIKVFLVDDDALFLKSLELEFLEKEKYEVTTFATGELCVAHLSHNPDVIILDYHLNGIDKTAMNGIDTMDQINTVKPDTPVIMLSSQDKIEVAINCMHHKAIDYVVKSETAFHRLHQIITTTFKLKKLEKELNWYMQRM
jgi:DNA-binding NtrC family response regulator